MERKMIKLNNDYEIISNKIKEMEEHFVDCKTLLDCFNYVCSYQLLVVLYKMCCGFDPQDRKISKNKFVSNSFYLHITI